MDAFAQQLALLQKTLSDTLTFQVQQLSETNARRLTEMRGTLETQLAQLQQSNTAKLDEMRQTVDEKLQTTLQARLGESFKQVADRLEQVHKSWLRISMQRNTPRGQEVKIGLILPFDCQVDLTMASPFGCQSMPSFPMKITNAC
jgi:DNA-binding transcriptional regulator YbjK